MMMSTLHPSFQSLLKAAHERGYTLKWRRYSRIYRKQQDLIDGIVVVNGQGKPLELSRASTAFGNNSSCSR
jgi:hypothetical protein